MAFTPYATPTEFKSWVVIGDTVDDEVIGPICNTVTQWIDEYTQRHFWRDGVTGTEVARTFEPCHRYRLDLDDLVPGSVTAFKTDEAGDGTFEITWAAGDYQLLPFNRPDGGPHTSVAAIASRQFPVRWSRSGRADRVEITGIWGWPTIPHTVRQACLIQSSRILKRRHSPEGVIGPSEFGVVRVSTRLDPDVQQLLDPYRRHVVLVA